MKLIKCISLVMFLLSANNIFSQADEVNIPFGDPSGSKTLKLQIFQGDIKIVGTDRSDVLVKYQVTKDGEEHHKEKNKEKNKDKQKNKSTGLKKISSRSINLEITCKNNVAFIKSDNWDKYLKLEIEVPKTIALDIHKEIGGNILIEKINGNLNLETSVGDITAKNISGLVNASTASGSIIVQFDDIPESKTMMFTSTVGSIDLSLPSNYKADLKLKSEMGEIYSDLDIVIQESPIALKKENENGNFKYSINRWIHASYNGGGAEVMIKTQIGDIYLRKKGGK